MVAGHLRARGGYWHMVVSFSDETGKRVFHTKTTRLALTGNKKRAEEMLVAYRKEWTKILKVKKKSRGIYFDLYLVDWLSKIKKDVSPTTYLSYSNYIRHTVCPYFGPMNLAITDVTPTHISEFYERLSERSLSNNTIRRIHANLHKAMAGAVADGLIPFNPSDGVALPKAEKYEASFYTADECRLLFEAISGSVIEIPVLLAIFLGLRRSEILGLKWDAVDFENHTIRICRAVTQLNNKVIESDKLKRKSSHRTFPIPEELEKILLGLPKDNSYICLAENGIPLTPNALTSRFSYLLKKNNLRHIRFHDLRHTCAALLISSRVPMYEVSKWMGHSTIAITYDLYGHIEFENKIKCASALSDVLRKE